MSKKTVRFKVVRSWTMYVLQSINDGVNAEDLDGNERNGPHDEKEDWTIRVERMLLCKIWPRQEETGKTSLCTEHKNIAKKNEEQNLYLRSTKEGRENANRVRRRWSNNCNTLVSVSSGRHVQMMFVPWWRRAFWTRWVRRCAISTRTFFLKSLHSPFGSEDENWCSSVQASCLPVPIKIRHDKRRGVSHTMATCHHKIPTKVRWWVCRR